MSVTQWIAQETCGTHSLCCPPLHRSFLPPWLLHFILSFLCMFCLFPLLLCLSFVPLLQIYNTRNSPPLIFKPLFIYFSFRPKNIKKVNTTDSSTHPLICSFVFFSVSSTFGQMWQPPVWPGKTVSSFGFDWRTTVVFLKPLTESCQKPKLHFAALMLMMSCNTKVRQITTASSF